MIVKVDRDALQRAFEALRASPAFAESAAVVARGGDPVEMLQAMSLRPELLKAFGGLSEAIYPGGLVERSVKEFIILDVSRRNRCQFCESSHLAMCRMIGITEPERKLDTLEGLSSRERLAVLYARSVTTNSNAVPESLTRELRDAFTDAELVEITAMIGLISMLNMFNNALGVRYRDDYGA
ncbi:MAG: carboxymuconolactone decarboxylase family protein [Phycisphaerae bacterium]|nr:carboxymuconolactone decarboxylase family protein [Phycisphaerae bacterium]